MLHCSFSLAAAQLLVKKPLLHCRKANVAVQLLQRSIPKTAAQLSFSLVACCRGGVQRGGVYDLLRHLTYGDWMSSTGPPLSCRMCPVGGGEFITLVAPYCAIPRDYLSDTPLLRAMGFLVSQHGQLGAIPPPPFSERLPLGEHAECRCDTPPPSKRVSQRYLRDTL